MSIIFIVQSSKKILRKRISQIVSTNYKNYYLSGHSTSPDILSFISNLGWKSIETSIERSKQYFFLQEYLEVIASFNAWNGHDLKWWSTHFSSKNRFNSPILPLLKEWILCLQGVKNYSEKSNLVLLDVSWEVVEGLKALSTEYGWNIQVNAPKFSHLRYRLRGKVRFWSALLKEANQALLSIYYTRKNFGSIERDRTHSDIPIYLIKSFTYLRNFDGENGYLDPFFGNLSNYLREFNTNGMKVLTVALGFHDQQQCYASMKSSSEAVHPLESYLTYSVVLLRWIQWLIWLLLDPFRMKGRIFFQGYELTAFFREFIRCGGFRVSFFQALHFDVAYRLGKLYNIKACLLTYEGRQWERFFMAGLKASRPTVQLIGCQHTVIPLSATDMFLNSKERESIPLPDKIITTGLTTKKILNKFSAYPKEQVFEGCALRFEELQKLSLIPRKNSNENSLNKFTLLVAFGGIKEEVTLLNYALEQAEEIPSVVFRVRNHPAFALNQLLKLSLWSNKVLPKNVEESNSLKVIEDIKLCDAVLYWGTTVSLEALMVGKPIIQFDRGDILNYDPLFEFKKFKWQVWNGLSLKDTIQEIQEIPDFQYRELQKQGRQYIEEYLYPVTPERLSLFLPNS